MNGSTPAAEGTCDAGLYRPECEHDACGVAFVANVRGVRSHQILSDALSVLSRLEHRGGAGTDPLTGDGSGVLFQIPHSFFAECCSTLGFELPDAGKYGVGMLFLPSDPTLRKSFESTLETTAAGEQLRVLGWRDVPIDSSACGPAGLSTLPIIRQIFLASDIDRDSASFERALYLVRKLTERAVRSHDASDSFAICTLSSRTICYKGLLLPGRLSRFFLDLADSRVSTAIAVVHERFSTNTFPSWRRAHPYRLIAHNGEINALRGNIHAMRARESALSSLLFANRMSDLLPIIDASGSDSAMFDNVLELLVQSGRSLPHALLMMIPEAWEKQNELDDAERAFYEFHASLMEPWDGPAAMAFTDGSLVGAILDRNGLRPMRYVTTTDGVIVAASEAGVLDVASDRVVRKGRVAPGRMLLVDTDLGEILDGSAVKHALSTRQPYGVWLENLTRVSKNLEVSTVVRDAAQLYRDQQIFGYTREDLKMVLSPMSQTAQEAVGSMGNDAALAILSERPQLLFSYFKQLFAQVTNPPIDSIREELVMSLRTLLGAEGSLLDESADHCRQIVVDHPILSADEFESVRSRGSVTLSSLYRIANGGEGLRAGLAKLCDSAVAAIEQGATILIVSDRKNNAEFAPIPSVLATAAIHHHLIREGLRTRASLLVESGEPREVMHFCLLVGYGASAVHPYLACETVHALATDGAMEETKPDEAVERFLHAANKGILKVMSKMGISTVQSYRGAQIFEAIGLSRALVDEYFVGTHSRIEGMGLEEIARECVLRHQRAFSAPIEHDGLEGGGQYQWRRDGEAHAYNPDSIANLQHAVRSGKYALFKRYSAQVNDENRTRCTLRGLLAFVPGDPISIDQVEPVSAIVERFKTGAMSFGSISREAHETIAIAMNRIGGRSNSGEGGEDSKRYELDANGDSRRSAIKQIASGRFGVSSHYLVNADELQIKMAQGAKPGEGGQLPGHKVDENIARVRNATEGVGLISPPPHHDIYSIEDLAQLIHDLKNANDRARVSVKLVAEVGVGTIAAGVAKAKADVILISGDSGGTGAAPLTSIKNAGIPWEIGLAEAQQVLVMNGLRGRVRLETDGQLKTGRDVAVACLLGAEEFGFATAALVASGCIMMRVCHLNTCPVGIATQDPVLRKRFAGEPEHVINFMFFVAEELREIMAELGFRTVDEMVGRVDRLTPVAIDSHWKARSVDLRPLLQMPPAGAELRQVRTQDHGLENGLDARLLPLAKRALEHRDRVRIDMPIANTDRTACTRLSSEITRIYGENGLPSGTVTLRFRGTAGQSFGAFLAEGMDVRLEGEANDYLAKGMSGGRIVVVPPSDARFVSEENVIAGNVVLYGATRGELYLRGQAGERFAVRNSGAIAVVEGVGDHGCEYMTRGTVVVLGRTGRNFAAGMSGGVAYVLDTDHRFETRCNRAMVSLERPDGEDLATLRTLIHRHQEYTSSAVAWRVLSGWRDWSQRFVKVMPHEYRNALSKKHLSVLSGS